MPSVAGHDLLVFFRWRPVNAWRHADKSARWEPSLQIFRFDAPDTEVDRHQSTGEIMERGVFINVVTLPPVALPRKRSGIEANDPRQASRCPIVLDVIAREREGRRVRRPVDRKPFSGAERDNGGFLLRHDRVHPPYELPARDRIDTKIAVLGFCFDFS